MTVSLSSIMDKIAKMISYFAMVKDISKRQQMEEVRRNSEERCRQLLERLPDGIYRSTPEGKFLAVNLALVKMLGYESHKELLKVNIIKDLYFSPKERADPLKHLESRKNEPVILRLKKKDGGELWVEDHGQQVFDAQGRPIYYEGVLRDITKRKRAAETLRESEEKYRNILENIEDGYYEVDVAGNFTFFNDSLCEIFGYSADELMGMNNREYTDQENARQVYQTFNRVYRTGEAAKGFEWEIIRKDGTRRFVEASVSLIRNAEGDATGFRGIIRDITDRKRSEEKLVRLATAVEQTSEIIVITDTNGEIQYVNPAFERITGYSREEAVGQNPRILKSGKHDQKFYKNLWDTLKKGEVWSGRFTNKKKDGTLYEEEAIISPVSDVAGNIINFVALKRDITQEVMLEAQLFHAQKMETIGTLAGGVAHDFNNLLTVILGNAEFGMQDSKPEDAVYKDLTRIEKASTQACDLISQLLSFSRRQVLKPKLLNLNKTIEELLKMLKRIICENIELKTKLTLKLATVWADPVQVQQVLMNLCVNARDAMPQGGQLVLRTRNVRTEQIKVPPDLKNSSTNYVEITVTDTGVGMDKETQERIFEPFFTTKEVGKGTGLGLSVVYGIVKQHDGHIEVSSEKGKGTAFKVYFPAIEKPNSSDHRKKKVLNIPGGDETILIVEDGEAVRNVTVRILKSLGYSVLTARNGKEGIKTFETHHEKIDLVILDVVLPKLGGPEVCQRMKSFKPNIPVLFVTGYDIKAQLNEFSNIRQEDIRILQKPYTKETLGTTVHDILDSRE